MNKPWGKEFGYYGKDWTHYSFLAKETCKFLNDNFRGSVIADPGDVGLNKVLYEMESYTHFIRMVFDFVFGRSLIRINFHTVDEDLEIKFAWKGKSLTEDELSQLIIMGRNAGAEVRLSGDVTENILLMLFRRHYTNVLRVYAIDDPILTHLFIYEFRDWYFPVPPDTASEDWNASDAHR